MKDIVAGSFDITYEWNAGGAASRFLEGLKQGRILGARCPQCKRVLVPPTETCERCSGRTEPGVEVASSGTVVSFTLIPLALSPSPCPLPPGERGFLSGGEGKIQAQRGIIMVRLDGADTDFLHLIRPGAENMITIGTRVQAVWMRPEERKGHILDIVGFEPC